MNVPRTCFCLFVTLICIILFIPSPSTGQTEYLEMVKLTSPDIGGGDHFGEVVAIDGDTIAVGVPDIIIGTGAVYVYERNAGGSNAWGLTARLLDPTLEVGEFFGYRV